MVYKDALVGSEKWPRGETWGYEEWGEWKGWRDEEMVERGRREV